MSSTRLLVAGHPAAGVFPLSSKRASILVLGVLVVLPPLALYLLDPPWPPVGLEAEGAPHLVLLAITWVFAVPLPYWGSRGPRDLGRPRSPGCLAALLPFVLALTLTLAVGRYLHKAAHCEDVYTSCPPRTLDLPFLFGPLLGSLAVLSRMAFRSLAASRVESLGSLMVCSGAALGVLWFSCAVLDGSTWRCALLVAGGLLIAAGHVHMVRRLRWLRRVVDGQIPGVRAVSIPSTPSKADWEALDSLHDLPWYRPPHEAQRFILRCVNEGDYRTDGERDVARFYVPLPMDWLRTGALTTADTVAISVLALFLCGFFSLLHWQS